jgi:transposase
MESSSTIDEKSDGKARPIKKTIDPYIIIYNIYSYLGLSISLTRAKQVVCLILIATGLKTSEIIALSGLSERTVRQLKRDVVAERMTDYFETKSRGRKSMLYHVEKDIVNNILDNNYVTRQEIADMIKNNYDITCSVWTVGRLLKKHNIRLLKSGSLPAKADPVIQREFLDNTLTPLIDKAKKGMIKLFFTDASHFVMGNEHLGRFWGKARKIIRTFSGRKRYNVLGALDFITKQVTTVTNATYITATQVCDLLIKISSAFPEEEIYFILDNARYQKCKLVMDLAAQLHIHLVYIPPYSPNLNLIERFWKYVKGELRKSNHNNFTDYSEDIDAIIACKDSRAKATVNRLITDKFQMFDGLAA